MIFVSDVIDQLICNWSKDKLLVQYGVGHKRLQVQKGEEHCYSPVGFEQGLARIILTSRKGIFSKQHRDYYKNNFSGVRLRSNTKFIIYEDTYSKYILVVNLSFLKVIDSKKFVYDKLKDVKNLFVDNNAEIGRHLKQHILNSLVQYHSKYVDSHIKTLYEITYHKLYSDIAKDWNKVCEEQQYNINTWGYGYATE